MTQVKIEELKFTEDVNSGMTRNELKEKYQVPVAIINEAAKRWNLTITIKKQPKYVFVDASDSSEVPAENTVEQFHSSINN